jgi:hypothetical protein
VVFSKKSQKFTLEAGFLRTLIHRSQLGILTASSRFLFREDFTAMLESAYPNKPTMDAIALKAAAAPVQQTALLH